MFSDPPGLAARVATAFDATGIPYLIGGSVATTIYGELRSTLDVDFVALMSAEHVSPLVRALEGEFYIDEEMIRTAICEHAWFNIIRLATADRADIFLPQVDARIQTEMLRRRMVSFEPDGLEVILSVASPEDIVLRKLEFYRDRNGFADRQWRDVLGVLKTQRAALESDYMREWADTFDIRVLLERALDEAGSPDRG